MSKLWPSSFERFRKRDKVVDLVSTSTGSSDVNQATPPPLEVAPELGGSENKVTSLDEQSFHNISGCDYLSSDVSIKRIYPTIVGYDGLWVDIPNTLSLSETLKVFTIMNTIIKGTPSACGRTLAWQLLLAVNVVHKTRWDDTSRVVRVVCPHDCCLLFCRGLRDLGGYFFAISHQHRCKNHNSDFKTSLYTTLSGAPSIDPRMSSLMCGPDEAYSLEFFEATFRA